MSSIEDALDALETAERSLRAAIAKAASTADYEDVATITRWAATLGEFIAQERDQERDLVPSTRAGLLSGTATGGRGSPASETAVSAKKSGHSRKGREPKYPLFARDGANLVKIGWSKSKKAEYEHRASRQVLDALLSVLRTKTASKTPFTMEEMLPVSLADGTEAPNYQVYVCMAWLKTIGLVSQHGRRGYSVSGDVRSDSLAEKAWQSLDAARR